ncbi:MAG: extracellular solute-binding protein [Verrucomicrobia bacterium]|nr:extracellular solute-binding protein [Verrucomicrobiota bacterium]
MLKPLLLLAGLAVIVGAPFALKPKVNLLVAADHTLVIITPHNESIRTEFARGFREHYKAKHNRTVRIDWRVIGGTSEITRYLTSEYESRFSNHWRQTLKRPWTDEVAAAYSNAAIKLPADPAMDTPSQAARRAFLESKVGIGIDLFFGGGSYDFDLQARAGRLVDSGVLQRHPEWFGEHCIPQSLGGENYYDPNGHWVGTVLSGYGILSNLDVLKRIGVAQAPTRWASLAAPAFRRQLALADPTKSSAAAKAFEMLIQQQMNDMLAEGQALAKPSADPRTLEQNARDEGWRRGMQLLIKLGGNTRYFSDTSQKPSIDVGAGDAACAMAIDFYARQEAEASARRTPEPRIVFLSPSGGTSYGVDPIGLLRGAQEEELAKEFIDYVLSLEGQKLWNYRRGTPGGPQQFSLRRLPIRPELYGPEHQPFINDADVRPYDEARNFTYRADWTGHLFRPMSFVIRVMCLDSHEELKEAWREVIAAGMPPEATRTLLDVSKVDYAAVSGPIRQTLVSADKIDEVRLADELGTHFREQYRKATELARARK